MRNPFSTTASIRRLIAGVAFLVSVAAANAETAPPFPSDPNAWINSGPLSVTGLKGKGIVLWFFEEDSPECEARWPEMVATAKKFDGKPVVFIAVNSGNPKVKTDAYVRQVKVPWPVLVDSSRDFEKACGLISEINLENSSQIRYIKPDGEILAGVNDDLDEIAEKAVEGAKWKVEPTEVPDSLKSTWTAFEIGNYKGMAASLKKSQASSKAEVKEAAAKLMAAIQQEIDDQWALVKETQEGGNTFRAYELLTEHTDRFAGFELSKDVAALKKELSKDAKVKAGIAATKSLEGARKQLALGNPAIHKKAIATLEKIVADFPDTGLALQAKSLIDYSK
jgi:peroxiredoxin